MNNLVKLKNKIDNKWLGKKAYTKEPGYFGKAGIIQEVKIQPNVHDPRQFKLYFLIDINGQPVCSLESNTVIYLEN